MVVQVKGSRGPDEGAPGRNRIKDTSGEKRQVNGSCPVRWMQTEKGKDLELLESGDC